MNYRLKAKIVEKYGKQWVFAKVLGIDETIVSRIVTGARELSKDEQNRWAEVLQCKPEKIFNE